MILIVRKPQRTTITAASPFGKSDGFCPPLDIYSALNKADLLCGLGNHQESHRFRLKLRGRSSRLGFREQYGGCEKRITGFVSDFPRPQITTGKRNDYRLRQAAFVCRLVMVGCSNSRQRPCRKRSLVALFGGK
ncbi:hypothetical protein AVEN_265398-1 [Araneus ventricosus]|uniref:Uncharacterized protein n=1 Tax=Araneus ventricosus TaxID=182803 RepID=A0A4Y2HQ30_ARAVE|nr:hypothetical protein AVEN_265398-1 [Araneus ventricosus]